MKSLWSIAWYPNAAILVTQQIQSGIKPIQTLQNSCYSAGEREFRKEQTCRSHNCFLLCLMDWRANSPMSFQWTLGHALLPKLALYSFQDAVWGLSSLYFFILFQTGRFTQKHISVLLTASAVVIGKQTNGAVQYFLLQTCQRSVKGKQLDIFTYIHDPESLSSAAAPAKAILSC